MATSRTQLLVYLEVCGFCMYRRGWVIIEGKVVQQNNKVCVQKMKGKVIHVEKVVIMQIKRKKKM